MVKITEASSGIFPKGMEVEVDGVRGKISGFSDGMYRIITDDGILFIEQSKVKLL